VIAVVGVFFVVAVMVVLVLCRMFAQVVRSVNIHDRDMP